jgi:hypothetical protein
VILVDIPGIGLRFIQVTVQTEAEIAAQRAAQAKVGTFGRAFVFVFRRVEIAVPRTVPGLVSRFLVMIFTTPPAAPLP